jgi:hypothetical protein
LRCSAPLKAGRTIYSRCSDTSSLAARGIRGVKSKGIQALVAESEGVFTLVSPSPGEQYSDIPFAHIALDEDLQPRVAMGGPKALHSLLESGAVNEYRFQNALASVGAGLPALMVVSFGAHDAPEFDCFDRGTKTRRTGGVFLAHDPDADIVALHVSFIWHRLADGTVAVTPPHARPFGPRCTLADLVANFVTIYDRVTDVNARAIFEAGVTRHASVATNFLINRFSDQVYQTDLDTCLDLSTVPRDRRGPQVIRDVSSTLVKMGASLCLCAWSAELDDLLSSHDSTRLFRGALKSYFGRFVDRRLVDEAAARLQLRLLHYVQRRGDVVVTLKDRYALARLTGNHEAAGRRQDTFRYIMEPFYKDCILELYALLKGSRFETAGYALPTISGDALSARLDAGLLAYQRAVAARAATRGAAVPRSATIWRPRRH